MTMTGLSGLAVALAVATWVVAIGLRSQRYAVWAVAGFSVVGFFVWKAAIDAGHATLITWAAGVVCLIGLVKIVSHLRKGAS